MSTKKQKKILFLDMGGVLVTFESQDRGIKNPIGEGMMWEMQSFIDPKLVEKLNKVFEAHPDVKIVMSSSWRKHLPIEKMKVVLKRAGITQELIAYTPQKMSYVERGAEIKWYLEESDKYSTNFVIVDDTDEFYHYPYLKERFVQTDGFQVGISDADVDKIIKLFGIES